MQIIPANHLDIPTIQKIAKASWQNTYFGIISQTQIDYMLSNFYSDAEMKKQMDLSNYHYFLLRKDDITYGFAGVEHQYDGSVSKLHRIYFVPEAKGKGMGGFLLDYIFDHCKENNARSLILNVNKYNSAKSFYEKKGMKILNEVILDIGEGYVMDDYVMEKVF